MGRQVRYERRLRHAAVAALEQRGARVELDPEGETLTRLLDHKDGSVIAVVHAQGVPSLMHELVHVLQAGRLADDHGIDYRQIPFDLGLEAGRRVLFEELACCTVSCSYLRWGESDVDAWFVDQVELQPVFYGLEADPGALWRRMDAVTRDYASALEATIERAHALTRQALAATGAEDDVAVPSSAIGFAALWARNRARLPGT